MTLPTTKANSCQLGKIVILRTHAHMGDVMKCALVKKEMKNNISTCSFNI